MLARSALARAVTASRSAACSGFGFGAPRFGYALSKCWASSNVNVPSDYATISSEQEGVTPLVGAGAGAPSDIGVRALNEEETVNNILYNTPDHQDQQRQIFAVLVDNEPGVLSRLSGLLSARGFNIDSLNVCDTENKRVSRMTISLLGGEDEFTQVRAQLEDLVFVWAVVDYTNVNHIERELFLAKVSTKGVGAEGKAGSAYRRSKPVRQVSLDLSEAAALKSHQRRQAIIETARMFGGSVEDVGAEHVTVQLTTWRRRGDAFLDLLRPYGIIETVRSGVIAMPRSRVNIMDKTEAKREVDLSSLPPS